MAPEGPMIGAFDLRGNLVPLLDVEVLSGRRKHEHSVQRAVVLQHDGRVLAVAVDDIVRLSEARPIEARNGRSETGNETSENCDDTVSLFPSGFVLDGEVVSCLNADALFARVDVLSVAHVRAAARHTQMGHDGKYLIFRAGGAHFGIDTRHISATVPKGKLDPEGVRVEGGLCLGFADHFGWRVPVVDTNCALGVGAIMSPHETETVLLRFPDTKLLGLHVDSTERLSSLPDEQLNQSSLLVRRNGLLTKVHITGDGTQVFVIDFDALSRQHDLLSLSMLSSRTSSLDEKPPADAGLADDAVRENQRYLVFEAGATFAVPARSLSRILRMPSTIVPGKDMPAGVKGFFSHDNRSVPLVILPQSDHMCTHDGFVLLVTSTHGQVGFFASRICAMKTSEWRIPNRESATETADLIKIRNPDTQGLVTVADLGGIAKSLVTELIPTA
ncbi:MAG: chemotaxis protein CheW [Pseudomonadota bacterium]